MATAVEIVTALLSVGGMFYMLLALWGARDFTHACRRFAAAQANAPGFAPDVTILKPVKGVDARMYEGLASHCRQEYAGHFEILFGVSSADDPAVEEISRLQREFPQCAIRLIVCPLRLGTSGKVSNLVQMLREAKSPYVLINDSDIRVSPKYLTRVMARFGDADGNEDPQVGMVTALFLGRTEADGPALTLWARLEALAISTDFMAGVLSARRLEGGVHFGLGATLAMSRAALAAAGGLEPLVDSLADDNEMGLRIERAGYRIELCGEVVETAVPAYDLRGFCEHQLRWSRTLRDARRWGYLGLGVTYCIPWAVLNCVASGFALWSFTLLSLVVLARVAVALSVGVGVLGDDQVLRDIWLLPLRDFIGMGFWAWSYASDTVVWRGERFRLHNGRISRA
ncbi:MAG TPA: bacteriohopanetetrol glucosamine biosynthesis glycosyltransferase HpnI [Acidobacteriaceae bacterium]|jgi:ceramide glucosyltransferase|nr:bacteriohopanetetrol glucosamine biosynthesis glycosyltransferase HpnI [Acidobacteriaceae bacterium]